METFSTYSYDPRHRWHPPPHCPTREDPSVRTILRSLAIAGISSLLAWPALAQQPQDRVIRFGHLNNADHPVSFGVKRFAELLATKSGGRMKVQEFPASQLGNEMQQQSALQGGVQQMSAPATTSLAGIVKEFGLVDFPFAVSTFEQADALLDGPLGRALIAKLPEKGLVALGYWDLGFRNVTNSKLPIAKADDIAGLKIRVIQSPLYIDLFNTLGANATPLPFPELYAALDQKAVDGQENPNTTLLASKFAEVQKYITQTRHIYNPQALLIGRKTWDGMSAEERRIIEDAAREATQFQRGVSRGEADKALEALKAAGMVVSELPPAEMAKLREKVKPVVEKYAVAVGAETVKELNAEIARVRK